ncbi:MAG: tyrosine-type recombinase/integrase [Acidimicrobiales bacterium]
MSAPAAARSSDQPLGLTDRIVEVLRTEFRPGTLVFPASDPVFGGSECLIANCLRSARSWGLCSAHFERWKKDGRPPLEAFVAKTDQRWARQRPNARCRAPGCGYGVARSGLCSAHFQRWDRAGRPSLEAWLSGAPAVKQPGPGASCLIAHCELWPHGATPFCRAHAGTWRANGRPDIEEFARSYLPRSSTAAETIELGKLTFQLKLEVQYALQCRRDDRASKLGPAVVRRVVNFLAEGTASSLLDMGEDKWRAEAHRRTPKDQAVGRFLAYAHRKLDDLANGDAGWEAEFGRDVWLMRRLGRPGNEKLSFKEIPQPWLRDLTKRWLRWRLAAELNLGTVRRGLRSLTRFGAFCARVGVASLADVDRPLLERYLADLHSEWAGRQRHNDHIGQLESFLQAIRQHRWDGTLPANALIFADDHPKRTALVPRVLAEHVMAQVEQPANLDRWDNPAFRLVTLVLVRCGLRVTDALRLKSDCVVTDAEGAPYLRYVNHKMKREALVPIDQEVHAEVVAQRERAGSSPWLFPRPTKNPDGRFPSASGTYRGALYQWLQRCGVRDEQGRPVHLTPHQWRHTLGTRLINRDVPQEVVRRLLDHDSAEMTGHYARLNDTTVRRHWEAARKVDVTGKTVAIDQDGPLAEAAWARKRLDWTTQALPNGFCGLPVQKACPHANACLACPMFLTTVQFLPEHRQHREEVRKIVLAAERRGQARAAEMNRQVLTNLDRVIASLEKEASQDDGPADAG